MKVESRGKYPGVKLHLEPEEVETVLSWKDFDGTHPLLRKMGKKIAELQEETPNLLTERTPAEVEAILVKEVEKQSIQLKRLRNGQEYSKIDPEELQAALLKHVKKDK